jgi:hypothetical protein
MSTRNTQAVDKLKRARKGPSREVALKNLAKAHKKTQTSLADKNADLSAYMSANSEASLLVDKNTCKAIMYNLGNKLSRLVEQSSKETLLKNSYGVKSISDAYQSYLKLVYPTGLQAHDSSHLSHLLGSIMPELSKSLSVNIHVTPPPQQPRMQTCQQSSKQPEVVDVSAHVTADMDQEGEEGQVGEHVGEQVYVPPSSGDYVSST